MKKFEAGKKYFAKSIANSDCVFEIEVTFRGNKFLTYINEDGDTRKSLIRIDSDGNEFIKPENYSMAPIFRAEREVAWNE